MARFHCSGPVGLEAEWEAECFTRESVKCAQGMQLLLWTEGQACSVGIRGHTAFGKEPEKQTQGKLRSLASHSREGVWDSLGSQPQPLSPPGPLVRTTEASGVRQDAGGRESR